MNADATGPRWSASIPASRPREHRFVVLCLVVFLAMGLRLLNGPFGGDFWQHAAVVRELATHLLHPRHPQLPMEAPTPFSNPYTILTAVLARALGVDAVTALSIMGLANLGLWFLGLRLFVFSIVPERGSAASFYALVLALFWWGADPWLYSGFFHIGVLGYVLPYPSTFAAALTLIALGVNQRRMDTNRHRWLVPIFAMACVVLISHPITFLFLGVGLLSQSCAAREGGVSRQVVLVGSLLVLVFAVSAFWPYFPLLNLFTVEPGVFDDGNREMYEGVFGKTWPALLALPLLAAGLWSHQRRPVVLMLLGLSVIYIIGGVSGRYSYGRVVSDIVLLLQVVLAGYLSASEERLRASGWPRLMLPAGVAVVAVLLSWRPLTRTLEAALPGQASVDPSYQFLSRLTGQYDVVLSDLESSKIIPVFGGKVVAAGYSAAFVQGLEMRQSEVGRFFAWDATPEERQQIVRKYAPDYLLLRKSTDVPWQDLEQEFADQGRVVFDNDEFVLISLGRHR